MEHLVSIVIPFYNRVDKVERAINSALNQTYINKEIILINDCSTQSIDKIKNIVEKNNNIISLYSNKKNQGASYSRNKGIKQSKGKFIAFLDSDDEWLSFKLEMQINFMINNKSKFTYTAYLRRVSENNKIKLINISSFQRYPLMGFHSNIATPTVVIEKSIACKKLFNTKFKYGEDIVYWWELSKYSQLRGINIPTSIINVSDASSSNNILNLSEGYANINKSLFAKNFFIKYIHKIYYKINLFSKRFVKILQKKF